MLRYIIKRCKESIKRKAECLKLFLMAYKNNCFLGKCLYIRNVGCIKLGRNIKIHDYFRIECYKEYLGEKYTPNLSIGNNVNIGPNFTSLVADTINIGEKCLFAGNVSLITENHGINPESSDSYQQEPICAGPIIIGKGCWFGQNVVVLPNVSIGERCIIGANSLVNTDIPPYSIAVGAPAHVVKKYNFISHKWVKCDD